MDGAEAQRVPFLSQSMTLVYACPDSQVRLVKFWLS